MITPVYIEWRDSAGVEGWSEDCELTPAIIQSVGILVSETEDSITLTISQDYNSTPKYDYLLCIPKFAITRREEWNTE